MRLSLKLHGDQSERTPQTMLKRTTDYAESHDKAKVNSARNIKPAPNSAKNTNRKI